MDCKHLCDAPVVVVAAAPIRPARGSTLADTVTLVRKQFFRHSMKSTGNKREIDTVDFIKIKTLGIQRPPSAK